MYGASHNLEISRQSLVTKNNIIIKEKRINWNSITESFEYQTKEFALNPTDRSKQKFCVKNNFASESLERKIWQKDTELIDCRGNTES